jgi:hypothetical protein
MATSDVIESKFNKLKQRVINSPEYKNSSQYDKSRMLNRLQNDISAIEYNADGYGSGKLTKKQQSLEKGGFNLDTYTNLDDDSGRTEAYYKTPDAEYKSFKKEYDKNIKEGKYDAAHRITATKKLNRLKIGSKYPKEVRDLYSLSKTDLYNYLTTKEKGVDKAKIAKQLIAYDKALYDTGLSQYLKFKHGIAPSSRGRGGSSRKYDAGASAAFRAAMRQQPLKIVGALPAPPKASTPSFKLPALKQVYRKQAVNTKPKSSLTRTRR